MPRKDTKDIELADEKKIEDSIEKEVKKARAKRATTKTSSKSTSTVKKAKEEKSEEKETKKAAKKTTTTKKTAAKKKDEASTNVEKEKVEKKAKATSKAKKSDDETKTKKTVSKVKAEKETTSKPKKETKKATKTTTKATAKKKDEASTDAKKVAAKKSASKAKAEKETKVEPKKEVKKTTAKKETTATKKTTAAKKTGTKTSSPKTKTSKSSKTVAKKKSSKKTEKNAKRTIKSAKTMIVQNQYLRQNIEILEYFDLPYRYNETTVKVLAQTPKILFVYWDISDYDRDQYKLQYGENFFDETYPVLLVKNETYGYVQEVPVNDFANSWYLHVNDSRSKYSIELGRKYKNKPIEESPYIFVKESNPIIAPNDHILFEELKPVIKYKNAKTNEITFKTITNVLKDGKIVDFYSLYQLIYNVEDLNEFFNLDNPSSGNPTSTFK